MKTRCRRLLILDDEVLVLRALARALGQEYDVTTLSSPEEALICLSRGSWDIILSDVMMPEMDGVEFARRAVETCPELTDRIMLRTGGTSASKARTVLEESGFPVIAKPIDLATLRSLSRSSRGSGRASASIGTDQRLRPSASDARYPTSSIEDWMICTMSMPG